MIWKFCILFFFLFCQQSCVFINSVFNTIHLALLYFGNLVVFIFILRKLFFFVFRLPLTAHFCFFHVLSSCISLRALFMFCFTMPPIFSCINCILQLGHLIWLISWIPLRIQFSLHPRASVVHSISSCGSDLDSGTRLPTTLMSRVAWEGL